MGKKLPGRSHTSVIGPPRPVLYRGLVDRHASQQGACGAENEVFFGSLRREAHLGRGRVRSEATCTVLDRTAGLPGTDLKDIQPRLEARGRVRGIVVAKRGCCETPSHSANSTVIAPTPPKGAGVYNQCIYRFVSNSARRYSRIES